ncbi:Gamma-glutamyltranspeptidase [Metarhizium album ARSEF 1941]|uniref:Gamma-glutamyltranspeptidase n=1 Tax=Metarhizium album (strain ARSEF 1941) TaxID=1081103 RepID=A0A0B2X060_METAS|nr:Gamma-glutamyltranspeptidase [Metarhizium album ARSEF 1941]KHN99214.1 Gamma-glutamyltranspeptidase [Metarhizium album ARSEF 1941]
MECSAIGRDLLARGGNAADALVGTTFCVGVVGMYHSGIGGGGFAMIRDPEGNYEAVDFREAAPAAGHEDMYQGNVPGSIYGGLAVGVPSEVLGLEYIHGKYGVCSSPTFVWLCWCQLIVQSLPWKTVMQGAIHVARYGFRISTDFVGYVERTVEGKPNFLVEDPNWAQDFAPNGTLLQVGDIMTRKRYANTLEKIANQGAKVFYTGELAETLVKYIQQTNGTLTLSDFKNYKVISRPVKNVTYRGLNLYTIGSPAGGSITLNILKIMENFDLADSRDANLTSHRFVEAMRFGYGARAELGDPAFVKGMDEYEAHLLDEAHARHVRERISDEQTLPVKEYDPKGVELPESHGTSHIVTADKSGMATSLTTTVNLLFGAQIMDPSSGIILNNEMNDFSIPGIPNEFGFEPSVANFIRPGKRPLSSVTPVIAEFPDGRLFATVGAAGGSRIISSTATALWHTIEHDMSMREALREPRLHDQVTPNTVLVEYGFDARTAAGLMEKKHNITWVRPGLSAVQGIRRLDDGLFEAASEPRQKNSGGLAI